ncbi:MAG: hypothetical protein UT87_C0006G0027 [Candidatus Levybacteria bacterium GW2011_GWC1_40_19]|nr:MAG: hypothetical protein UT46_C0009G0004 [Candidatus Levybacteria bacterium GW2011_GWA1_39_34]KKR51447.1 MAG: hypothetical protein UT87_C0006G0027 [Candidatus Levybacteria bacterium GW2011_GWC1_40_19]KKR71083.1 MAG: hypothetical protein UU15_C0060G0008 [Candidatus Levybacteria bacterium GW2011_GWC2_40_7]KKR94856.1 MAG: hypothetical protein UU45_C0006G0018 [Candidatus Levybacteria bacterium GW2011_GWA2_41_15]KKS01487.1 MAG: hypothetical protein UU52_C0011G0004 [Candidatus Levybacteria bacter
MIKLKRLLAGIWPTVYRVINTIYYNFISIIKKFLGLAIKQIKNG